MARTSLLSCSNVQHLVPGRERRGGGSGWANWVTLSESVADLGEKGLRRGGAKRVRWGLQERYRKHKQRKSRGVGSGRVGSGWAGVLISRTINRKLSVSAGIGCA